MLSLVGCGAAAKDRQLLELSRQVTAMKAELMQNDERLVELSNQVFVLADRLEGARHAEAIRTPALEVVRLVPEGAAKPAREENVEVVDVDLSGYDDPTTLPVAPVPPPPAPEVRRDATHAEAERQFQEALRAYREGRTKDAVQSFAAFVSRYPGHRYTDSARYWMGEARFEAQDFAGAASAFSSLLVEHPRSAKVPDALFRLGLAYEKVGARDKARQAFTDLAGNFPSSALAELARARLSPSSEGGTR